ncbi:unnamed protein product [Rhizoctonia solani]|uniref:Uncharacterized protein n=1 Tax=Rhizoctonia solani TaxID=456999 RepID=A0A8H2XW79_9AGAM|nr:unnamed protein product [Rhizoctonia solani]
MFHIATPLLWRNTTAGALIGLLDFEGVFGRIQDGSIETVNEFLGYKLIGPLGRFDIYARHAEVLEIYNEDLDWSDWHALRREADTRSSPLLPKLKAMRFMENTSPQHGMTELKWIRAFAAPGMEELSLTPDDSSTDPGIPYSFASVILRELSSRSPKIQVLRFPANDMITTSSNMITMKGMLTLQHQAAEPWYSHLQCMPNIRDLTVSDGWLYPPCLGAIGNLPNLTSLSLIPGSYEDCDHDWDIDPESIQLSTDTFPVLSHLSIDHLPALTIGKILGLKPMLRGITTLELEFELNDIDPWMEELETAMSRLFEGLRNLPYLQRLGIGVHPSLEVEWPVDISEYLSSMGEHASLKCVRLRGMCMDPEWCIHKLNLGTIWQNVEVLIMPTQPASIRELSLFATMPRLKLLVAELNLERPYLPESPNPRHYQKIVLRSTKEICLSEDFESLVLLARALRHLWPKIQGVLWSGENELVQVALADYFNYFVLPLRKSYLFGKPRRGRGHAPKAPEVPERLKLNFHAFMKKIEEIEQLSLAR